MASIKVVDLFAKIGIKVDTRALAMFEKSVASAQKKSSQLGEAIRTATVAGGKANTKGIDKLGQSMNLATSKANKLSAAVKRANASMPPATRRPELVGPSRTRRPELVGPPPELVAPSRTKRTSARTRRPLVGPPPELVGPTRFTRTVQARPGVDKLSNKVGVLQKKIDRLNSTTVQPKVGGLDKVGQKLSSIDKKLNSFTSSLKRASLGLGGFFGLMAAARAIGSIATVGKELDSLENAFATVSGSAKQGAADFAFVRAEAERLGLNMRKVVRNFVQLTAATKGTTLQGAPARELFTAMAEASTVLGLSAEQTKGSLIALQQIISKGKVSAEELRQQLGERLPGAFQIAARAMGVTTKQLDKMLVNGQLLSEEFIPKFTAQLKKEFSGGVAAAAKNAQATFNRFSNALFRFQTKIARSGFMLSVNRGLQGLTSLLDALGPLATGIGVAFRLLSNVLTSFSRILGKIAKLFIALPGWLQAGILAYAAYTFAATAAGKATLVFLRRLLFIPAIIAALALIVEDLIVGLEGGKSAIKDLTASTDPLVNAIGSVAFAFAETLAILGKLIGFILAGMPGGFKELLSIFSIGFGKIGELLKDEAAGIGKIFSDMFGALFDSLPAPLRGLLSFIGTILGGVLTAFQKGLGAVAALFDFFIKIFTGDFQGAWEALKATAGLIVETLLALFGSLGEGIMDVFIGIGSAIGDFFSDLFDGIVSSIDDAINSVLDILPDFVKEKLGIEVEATPSVKNQNIEATPSVKNQNIEATPRAKSRVLKFKKGSAGKKIALPAGLPQIDFAPNTALQNIQRIGTGTVLAPPPPPATMRQVVNQTTQVNMGGITNQITVPQGTTQEQQQSMMLQFKEGMDGFMDQMLIDAQAEVPEAS